MTVLHGDCLEVMPTLHTACIDAIVTDPPYGLSFMGKDWDHGVPGSQFWREAWRVAKPGAYLVAFGGTRTYHRLTCAIEDADWEIRDCLIWLYGSGFPKSHNISKAIDKAAGAEREVVGEQVRRGDKKAYPKRAMNGGNYIASPHPSEVKSVTAAATDTAREWEGWGTALKPAWEPIILARKPFSRTVAANVLEYATGALNIDGCRIPTDDSWNGGGPTKPREGGVGYATSSSSSSSHELGRWPANAVLDEEAARLLDEQSGELSSGFMPAGTQREGLGYHGALGATVRNDTIGGSGGASRFFYTAKASRAEREAGLREAVVGSLQGGGQGANDPVSQRFTKKAANTHPTVKPLDLMQWLCRLVTPKGGRILDPFCGSGTTGRAAVAEGFRFIGIEKEAEYAEIARARILEYAPLFAEVAND